jgi:alanyl-tRNA synthetase
MNVVDEYKKFCESKGVTFQLDDKVNPYDDTTLFCPAGMQQFKSKFIDESVVGTIANIQSCIRLNDIDEIGDGTHLLYFNMMGLFSFRELTVKQAIDFWFEFLQVLGLKPDYITIHPDKVIEWSPYYSEYNVPIKWDGECEWSDGTIGGYCTEFYINGVEIGNIVNPLGTCVDVGFGLDRIESILTGVIKTKEQILIESIMKIIESGYKPSNLKQGYVLRRLLRVLYKGGGSIEHSFFEEEIKRQEKIVTKYEKLKDKHIGKSKEYWWETHGIDLDLI